MKTLRRLTVLLLLAGLSLVPRSDAASSRSEEEAFAKAYEPFRLEDFKSADTDLGAFVQRFPQSERRVQAVLYQAQARLKLENYAGTIELLTNSLASAGDWTGDYLYWLGMAQMEAGDARESAKTLARVSQVTTAPDLLRRASIGEGKARFLQGDFAGVVELLGASDGPLQTGLTNKPDAEPMVQGQLLFAEALLKLRRFRELELALEPLSKVALRPELDWHRLWLLASSQREEGDLAGSLATASNLVAVARTVGRQSLVAESTSFLGSVHRQLGHPNDAIAAFRQNLTNNVPASARQQALVNLISLQLEGDRYADATNELRSYTAQFPLESNVWSLVLGDLQLREYAQMLAVTNTTSAQLTQLLSQAHATLAKVSGIFTNSDLEGRAQLLLGWCFWEERNFEESGKAFQIAVARLSPSTDQLIARFKAADIQLKRGAATNAAAAYRQLVTDIDRQPDAQRMIEPLLYQWLRASVEIGDNEGADYSMQRLLREFPLSQNTENGFMMRLQWLVRSDPAGARAQYQEFSSRFPHSALLPEVELMIAQFHERERDWTSALKQYDEWLTRHGGNAKQPFAEYSRAMCAWRAGDTNAMSYFTSFVERYPTNQLTPLALQWIAEEQFRMAHYVQAQESYERIFKSTNWAASEVTLGARLGAGRAAFALYAWVQARDYLTNAVNLLTGDSNAPPELTAKAYLMLGDTILEQYLADRGASESLWGDAKTAYQIVADDFSTNQLAARAWGRIGAAHLQHGSRDTNYLANATNAWQKVIDLEVDKRKIASVELRSQAEVAIGMALESLAAQQPGKEKEAILDEAKRRYGSVIYRQNLLEGEEPNPRWYSQAALAAARLAQTRGDLRYAMNLYELVIRQFPSLRADLGPLIDKVKAGPAAKSN